MEKFLTQKDLKKLREELFNGVCPVCGRPTKLEEMSLDHIHGSHKSMYPETNKLCRDLICRDCNVLIGKIENQFLRSSREIKDQIQLPELLRKIADYIEFYAEKENFNELLVHPSEWKPKKIKKSWFNKLAKKYKEDTGKTIEYPSSGKLTKQLQSLSEKFDLEPEYYEK